jgi:hypothetical protein
MDHKDRIVELDRAINSKAVVVGQKRVIDDIDREAEREGRAVKQYKGYSTGPVGKKITRMKNDMSAGDKIQTNRVVKRVEQGKC